MTCDEARIHTLAELGGEGDDADARTHLATCSPCAYFRRESEQVWQISGRSVETCPRRRNLLQGGGRRRAPAAIAAAAALLIAAVTMLAWTLRPAPSGTPGQDPDAKGEELLKNDPELRKQVLRTALQEKERLAEFEKKVAEAEIGFAEAKALYDVGKVKEAADRSGTLVRSFPYLKLAVLDPVETRYRATLLRLRIRELNFTAQHRLLLEKPEPGDPAGLQERAEAEISILNSLREIKRQQEEATARGPQPRKEVVGELGGPQHTPKSATEEKLRSMRITIDLLEGTISDVVNYLREISGLSMALAGTKEERETKVSIKMNDVLVEALLEHLTKQAGYIWEVDRFGILGLKPAKK